MADHLPEGHDWPGLAGCPWLYPTFDDDPARWGLLPEEPLTEAEFQALGAEAGL